MLSELMVYYLSRKLPLYRAFLLFLSDVHEEESSLNSFHPLYLQE